MSLTHTRALVLILALVFAFVGVLPRVVTAVGSPNCACQYQDPKQPLYCPTVTCVDMTAGFATVGKCLLGPGPQGCKGMSTTGKDGFGLDQVAKILGDLMGKLMQGGGSPPPTTPPTTPGGDTARTPPTCSLSATTNTSNASSTNASLSWTSSYEATSASITPNIGTVSPNGSQTVTVTETTPYSMTVTSPGGTGYCSAIVVGYGDGGTDKCAGVFASIYGCEDDGDDDDTPATSTPSLLASPTSGTVPLTVVFTGNAGSAGYTLEFGDDKSTSVGCSHGGCSSSAPALSISRSHVYETNGTFTAKLRRHYNSSEASCSGADCNVVASATITVTAPQSTTPAPIVATTTVPVFSNPAYLLPGLRGDIQTLNSGGTVIVGSRNQGSNTEVAGFYGGSTFSGPATGVVASLCRARPWSSNFLSYVLPANFFDSLCVSRGYQVGAPPAQQTSGSAQAATPSTPAKPKPAATSTTSAPAVPTVAPKVRVWAVPSTVPLGSRASVFWTSQGVVSCLVASPDGSFSQTTLSGGASTVSLTGPTTFTISCLTAEGAPVTDFVTINLAI